MLVLTFNTPGTTVHQEQSPLLLSSSCPACRHSKREPFSPLNQNPSRRTDLDKPVSPSHMGYDTRKTRSSPNVSFMYAKNSSNARGTVGNKSRCNGKIKPHQISLNMADIKTHQEIAKTTSSIPSIVPRSLKPH